MPPQTQATAAVGEESVQSRPRSDMRFFFHMPKTAGGTLVRGIMRNAQVKWPLDPHYPRPLALPALSPAAQVWLGGHSAFGLHLLYNAEPTYITILREPVERLITEFFYHHEHNLPGMFIPDDEIIPAFVRHVEAAPHLNAYTYMFSDYCFAKESIEAGQGTWDGSIDTAFDLLRRRNENSAFFPITFLFSASISTMHSERPPTTFTRCISSDSSTGSMKPSPTSVRILG